MKKILVVVVGLVMSAGLCAETTSVCLKDYHNSTATFGGKTYIFSTEGLCGAVLTTSDAKTKLIPVQTYAAQIAGKGPQTLPANISMTLLDQTVKLSGKVTVVKVSDESEGYPSLIACFADIISQLFSGSGSTTSQFQPIDSK